MQERRKHRRFKGQLLITTIYKDEQGRIVTEESVSTEDISAGGVKINFPKAMVAGKILDVQMYLFNDPIRLPAQVKVAWSNKKDAFEILRQKGNDDSGKNLFWMGIQFLDINDFDRERIFRWIQKEYQVSKI